jgi:hypothetical protein
VERVHPLLMNGENDETNPKQGPQPFAQKMALCLFFLMRNRAGFGDNRISDALGSENHRPLSTLIQEAKVTAATMF